MKQKQPKKRGVLLLILIAVAAVCIAAAVLRSDPVGTPAETGAPDVQNGTVQTAPGETVPDGAEHGESNPAQTTQQQEPVGTEPRQEEQSSDPEQRTINLGYGLEITDAGSYSGAYVEDGSCEIVSDVMMVVVRNTGELDIQLADITALCSGAEYTFRLTNLAAGERAVLLELSRKGAGDAVLESAVLSNVAAFETPMELHEQTIQISGLNGMLNVKNISGSDISGDIYVYYKFAAQDIFYGGITFRVRVEGGLKADEIRQIPAGHYDPDGCRIIQVTIHE